MITLAAAAQIASITSGAIALGTLLFSRILPSAIAKKKSRILQNRLGSGLYSITNLERSLRYYIPPFCQDVDPAGGDEPRLVFGVKTGLFPTLDDLFSQDTEFRYIMILADSGMGKTSALLNYYTRHIKKFRQPYKIALIPLGIPDVDQRISDVSGKERTVLFLDALDEDTLAVVDHSERVRMLLHLARDFKRVVITCRTQFFARDDEIPQRTAVLKVGPRAAGEAAEFLFHKIYLSPFTDKQVKKYIKMLYPFWKREARKRALAMADRIRNLSARPMLLAHIDDLVRTKREASTAYDLYEEMVSAWLIREEGIIHNIGHLREFSERLAVDIYLNRMTRGAERVPIEQLTALASKWDIPIEDWKLSGRSLLNRDAEGNFKFAHRSIMEYLYVNQCLGGNMTCINAEWTGQMRAFLLDAVNRDARSRVSSFEGLFLMTGSYGGSSESFLIRAYFIAIHPALEHQTGRSRISISTILSRCTKAIFGQNDYLVFSKGYGRVHPAQVHPSAASELAISGTYEQMADYISRTRLTIRPATLEERFGDARMDSLSAAILYLGYSPIGCLIGSHHYGPKEAAALIEVALA